MVIEGKQEGDREERCCEEIIRGIGEDGGGERRTLTHAATTGSPACEGQLTQQHAISNVVINPFLFS